jgi:hypothetical protein
MGVDFDVVFVLDIVGLGGVLWGVNRCLVLFMATFF